MINTTHSSLTNNLFVLPFRLKSQWFIASKENVQGSLGYNKKWRAGLSWAEGTSLCVSGALFLGINVTEGVGLLCQFMSAPLWGKQRVRSAPVTFFSPLESSQSHFKVWGGCCLETTWNQRGNTFCVISEPHLLVVITKAYVSGFYIHRTSSGLYIHTREPSQAEWPLTKRQHEWAEAVQYIFTTLKTCRDGLKWAGMQMEVKRKENMNHSRKM